MNYLSLGLAAWLSASHVEKAPKKRFKLLKFVKCDEFEQAQKN